MEQPNWDEINQRKQIEICVGQAMNLANEAALPELADRISEGKIADFSEILNRKFEFYFNFLMQKHRAKTWKKPIRGMSPAERKTKSTEGGEEDWGSGYAAVSDAGDL